MKAYPSCMGGLDSESDWCNHECPKQWLQECLDRIIEKMAPKNAREIQTLLYFKDRVKKFAQEARIKK